MHWKTAVESGWITAVVEGFSSEIVNMLRNSSHVAINPDIFDHDLRPDGWVEDADVRNAVTWLQGFMEPTEWKERRSAALRHLIDAAVGGVSSDPTGKGRFFDVKDRFAWILFLGQALLEHPQLTDYIYQSRVVPVLASIGRDLHLLRSVGGVDARVQRMVTEEKAQPNACLYELLVAAAYRRAGANVNFVAERPGVAKTHDMDVMLGKTCWAVECKRLEESGYADDERSRVRELWTPLARDFEKGGLSVLGTVRFSRELSEIPDTYLLSKGGEWLQGGIKQTLKWKDQYGVGSLKKLNLVSLQRVLETDDVAMSSTRLHELLLGYYVRYAHIITALRIRLADNPLYIDSCTYATVLDWSSRSDAAIDRRARDIVKRVSDGCQQLPQGRPSVIHIGFEAVDDLDIERVRYDKVIKSLSSFDPNGKSLEYVYVNWFAPESPPNLPMGCDETCHWQAIRPSRPRPLEEGLLLLEDGSPTRVGVHWE